MNELVDEQLFLGQNMDTIQPLWEKTWSVSLNGWKPCWRGHPWKLGASGPPLYLLALAPLGTLGWLGGVPE